MSYYPHNNRRFVQNNFPPGFINQSPFTSFTESLDPQSVFANVGGARQHPFPPSGTNLFAPVDDFPSFSSPASYSSSPVNTGGNWRAFTPSDPIGFNIRGSPVIGRRGNEYRTGSPTFGQSSPTPNKWSSAREIPIFRTDGTNQTHEYDEGDSYDSYRTPTASGSPHGQGTQSPLCNQVRDIPIEVSSPSRQHSTRGSPTNRQQFEDYDEGARSNNFRQPDYFSQHDVQQRISPRQHHANNHYHGTGGHGGGYNTRGGGGGSSHHKKGGSRSPPKRSSPQRGSKSPSNETRSNQSARDDNFKENKNSTQKDDRKVGLGSGDFFQKQPSLSKVVEIPIITTSSAAYQPNNNKKYGHYQPKQTSDSYDAPEEGMNEFDSSHFRGHEEAGRGQKANAREIPVQVVRTGNYTNFHDKGDPWSRGPFVASTGNIPTTSNASRKQRMPSPDEPASYHDTTSHFAGGDSASYPGQKSPQGKPRAKSQQRLGKPKAEEFRPPSPPKVEKKTPEQIVTEINKRLDEELIPAAEAFSGTDKTSKEFLHIDDALTKLLLQLDAIESGGDEHIRQIRRDAVHRVNDAVNRLEAKVKVVRDRAASNDKETEGMTEGASEDQAKNNENDTATTSNNKTAKVSKATKGKNDKEDAETCEKDENGMSEKMEIDDNGNKKTSKAKNNNNKTKNVSPISSPKGKAKHKGNKSKHNIDDDDAAFATPPTEPEES